MPFILILRGDQGRLSPDHRRPRLAELHGNLFLETCAACGAEHLRDFDVGGISFRPTGRRCEAPGCTVLPSAQFAYCVFDPSRCR
jgi:mono-ADP-ribosyltransferase sirtuin 6